MIFTWQVFFSMAFAGTALVTTAAVKWPAGLILMQHQLY